MTDDAAFKELTVHKYNLSDIEFDKILNSIVNKYEPYVPLWKLLPEIENAVRLALSIMVLILLIHFLKQNIT